MEADVKFKRLRTTSEVTLVWFSPLAYRFLFEGNEDFSCLPTFGVIPSQAIMLEHGLSSVPGLDIDYSQVRGVCEYK